MDGAVLTGFRRGIALSKGLLRMEDTKKYGMQILQNHFTLRSSSFSFSRTFYNQLADGISF